MRIVHVTDAFQPQLGGIEVHVSDLATRQAAAGHEVHVVTTTPGLGGARPGEPGPLREHRCGGGWLRVLTIGSAPANR